MRIVVLLPTMVSTFWLTALISRVSFFNSFYYRIRNMTSHDGKWYQFYILQQFISDFLNFMSILLSNILSIAVQNQKDCDEYICPLHANLIIKKIWAKVGESRRKCRRKSAKVGESRRKSAKVGESRPLRKHYLTN